MLSAKNSQHEDLKLKGRLVAPEALSSPQVNAGLPGSDNTGCDFRQPKDEVQDELQIEEEVEDPAKARELRLEGNESFKVRRLRLIYA